VTDYVAKGSTLHYGAVAARAPRDKEAQDGCKLLGQRLAEWTATFVHGKKEQHPSLKLKDRMPPG